MPNAVFAFLFFFIAASVFPGGSKDSTAARSSAPEEKVVTVWTYDSFTSEWGPGPEVAKRFKEETGIEIRFVTQGDGGALLSRLLAAGAASGADVVLGLDQNLAPKALASGLLATYKPAGTDRIAAELQADPSGRLTPFDYGYFAIIYDSERIPTPPKSLEDLSSPAYARKLILMDPRTSTPGLGFLAWTREVYGDGWKDYWKRLAPSILTVAEGWDTGYGLFTAGEAPMVLSYTTSPAYHLEYESTERYRAAIFAEGHPVQIELAGLLAAAPHRGNGERFLDFMLSDSFQTVIPTTNWMYPVTDIHLPASFRLAPKSPKTLKGGAADDAALAEWARILAAK